MAKTAAAGRALTSWKRRTVPSTAPQPFRSVRASIGTRYWLIPQSPMIAAKVASTTARPKEPSASTPWSLRHEDRSDEQGRPVEPPGDPAAERVPGQRAASLKALPGSLWLGHHRGSECSMASPRRPYPSRRGLPRNPVSRSVARVIRRIGKRHHAEHLQQRLRAREGRARDPRRPARARSPGRARDLGPGRGGRGRGQPGGCLRAGSERSRPTVDRGRQGWAGDRGMDRSRPPGHARRPAIRAGPVEPSRASLLHRWTGKRQHRPRRPCPRRLHRPAGAGRRRSGPPGGQGRTADLPPAGPRSSRRGPSGNSRLEAGGSGDRLRDPGRPASPRPSRPIRGVAYGVARRLGRAAAPGGEPARVRLRGPP